MLSHLQPHYRDWVRKARRVHHDHEFITFNRIFASTSVILRGSGSVGMSLVMWVLGAAVAACGTAVYIELGTVRILVHYSESLDSRCSVRVFLAAAVKRYIWSISTEGQCS